MKEKNKKGGGWNYRILRTKDITDDYVYNIHEVYYTENKPTSWSKEPMYAQGDTRAELFEDILFMEKGMHQPVLEVKDGKLIEVKVGMFKNK